MPIIRKILNLGDSQGITLPKSWLLSAKESAGGKDVVAIALEVDGVITLKPIFSK